MKCSNVFLGLGSNLGDREGFLRKALASLQDDDQIEVVTCSSIIETEPVGHIEQGAYLNQAIEIATNYSPQDLLRCCLRIEKLQGRSRSEKWGPRTLDIDILFFDDLVLREKGLEIPHPEFESRSFVLVPMAEIAPLFEHPANGHQMEAILRAL